MRGRGAVAGSMKAQRGRKGLIACGEIIPSKRSKTEKAAAKKVIDQSFADYKNKVMHVSAAGIQPNIESNETSHSFVGKE